MPAAMNTAKAAADRLHQVGEKVPAEIEGFMRAAKAEVEQAAVRRIHPGAAPKSVGIYTDGPKRTANGNVEVEIRPRYIARWQEGGTKAHDVQRSDKVRYRNIKSSVRASKRAGAALGKVNTMLASGRDQKGQTLSARRRASLEKRAASAAGRQSAAEERTTALLQNTAYMGPLAIGKRAAHANVAQGTKPNTNFAAKIHHPGQEATQPIRKAIAETAPLLGSQLARRVNESWARVVT